MANKLIRTFSFRGGRSCLLYYTFHTIHTKSPPRKIVLFSCEISLPVLTMVSRLKIKLGSGKACCYLHFAETLQYFNYNILKTNK